MPFDKNIPYDFIANYTGDVATTAPAVATYAYRLHGDRLHYDVCLLGSRGPVSVKSVKLDGNHVEWEGHQEGDAMIFEPPDGHDINDGFFVGYDKRIMRLEAMDRAEIERFAMRYRVSVTKPEVTPCLALHP